MGKLAHSGRQPLYKSKISEYLLKQRNFQEWLYSDQMWSKKKEMPFRKMLIQIFHKSA